MITEMNRFYVDPDTQDRVRVKYRVELIMPATYFGYIEVEATSESEAAQLAMDVAPDDIHWDCGDTGDSNAVEVTDVACEEPPEGAILFTRGYYSSNANLDGLFGPQPHQSQAGLEREQ